MHIPIPILLSMSPGEKDQENAHENEPIENK